MYGDTPSAQLDDLFILMPPTPGPATAGMRSSAANEGSWILTAKLPLASFSWSPEYTKYQKGEIRGSTSLQHNVAKLSCFWSHSMAPRINYGFSQVFHHKE